MPTARRWTLRTASARDLPTLLDHYRAMWEVIGGHTAASIGEAAGRYARWARREMRGGRLRLWVAERPDGTIAGSGGLWFMTAHPRPGSPTGIRPYILSMYTAPNARGQGIATRIVREALRSAKEGGHAQVNLHAAPMGRRVYAGLGFERAWEMRIRFSPKRKGRGRPVRRSSG
jgi:GNAT superfamily N-acetyltransferase